MINICWQEFTAGAPCSSVTLKVATTYQIPTNSPANASRPTADQMNACKCVLHLTSTHLEVFSSPSAVMMRVSWMILVYGLVFASSTQSVATRSDFLE
eukprot:gene2654-8104_t